MLVCEAKSEVLPVPLLFALYIFVSYRQLYLPLSERVLQHQPHLDRRRQTDRVQPLRVGTRQGRRGEA